MTSDTRLVKAFASFDAYNAKDPNVEAFDGSKHPKELLYAIRMTEKLSQYEPSADESVKLAARCQHIGRWEIPRNSYPMDRKGYLQWRTKLGSYHASIAGSILKDCGYDETTIEKVKFLLQKKQLLQHHPETQLLEDVICLVFIEYYLEDFAFQHDDEKVIDILRKTIRKMSKRALQSAGSIRLPPHIQSLLSQALT